jgi:hypothetical protein
VEYLTGAHAQAVFERFLSGKGAADEAPFMIVDRYHGMGVTRNHARNFNKDNCDHPTVQSNLLMKQHVVLADFGNPCLYPRTEGKCHVLPLEYSLMARSEHGTENCGPSERCRDPASTRSATVGSLRNRTSSNYHAAHGRRAGVSEAAHLKFLAETIQRYMSFYMVLVTCEHMLFDGSPIPHHPKYGTPDFRARDRRPDTQREYAAFNELDPSAQSAQPHIHDLPAHELLDDDVFPSGNTMVCICIGLHPRHMLW